MNDFYAPFGRALLSPEASVPGVSAARFGVYRNNVAASLTNAMRAQFPATERLMSPESFGAAALAYVRASPPRCPLLFEIGAEFAAFLAENGALADHPFVSEVAALEYEMARAQHAADADPLRAEDLASVAEHDLPAVRFHWHPAARLLRTQTPAATICAQNRDGGAPAAIPDWGPQDILITRPAFAVDCRVLPAGGFEFLAAIRSGAALGEAVACGAAAAADFDPATHLGGLITSGCTAGLILSPTMENQDVEQDY